MTFAAQWTDLRVRILSGLAVLAVGLSAVWCGGIPVRLLASVSRTDQAPSLEQLGAPVTATPGVRVFDLARGETAEVTRTTGGASGLDAGQRDMLKLGLTYKPFEKTDLRFQANYVATRTTDAVVEFPSASTQVEAAFPDRFVRDADGRLVRIDARPVNFARQTREELRWGVTYSRRLGPQPTPEQIAAMRRRFAEAEAARAAGDLAARAQVRHQVADGERHADRLPVGRIRGRIGSAMGPR